MQYREHDGHLMESFHVDNGSYICLQVWAKARNMNGDLNVNRLIHIVFNWSSEGSITSEEYHTSLRL